MSSDTPKSTSVPEAGELFSRSPLLVALLEAYARSSAGVSAAKSAA